MPFCFNLAVISLRERKENQEEITEGRRKKTGTCTNTGISIPFDLVIEILTRLPSRSLMRFKSVSKLWSSLICSQYFTKRFQRVSSYAHAPRLYMGLRFYDNSHLKDALLSASPRYDDSDNTSISSFEAVQDLSIPTMRRGYSASHVFRGLMCLVDGQCAQIYNPTTRQLVDLPKIEASKIIPEDHKYKRIMYHITHDPLHDQYKVVCAVSKPRGEDLSRFMSEYWVLQLGGGHVSRQWRNVSFECPPHMTLTKGLTIDGRMYTLAWVQVLNPVLMCFDVSSEEISVHQLPKDMEWPRVDLIEYGDDKLAVLDLSTLEIDGKTKMWVMEDAMKIRWSSKRTLVLHPSQLKNTLQMNMAENMYLSVLQATTRKGEIILQPRVRGEGHYAPGVVMLEPQNKAFFYIFLYDLQKNDMRLVEINETPNRYLTQTCYIDGFDVIDNLMYL